MANEWIQFVKEHRKPGEKYGDALKRCAELRKTMMKKSK